jgi:hypothetical protein
LHAEGESPFIVKDKKYTSPYTSEEMDGYTACPVEGCGEDILFTDLESHMELHGAEGSAGDFEETSILKKDDLQDIPPQSVVEADRQRKQSEAKAGWKSLLQMPATSTDGKPKKLGVCHDVHPSLKSDHNLCIRRNQSLDLMQMRNKCLHGFANFSWKMAGRNSSTNCAQTAQ